MDVEQSEQSCKVSNIVTETYVMYILQLKSVMGSVRDD